QKVMSLEDFDKVKSKTKTIAVRDKEKKHRKEKKVGWGKIRQSLEDFWAADKTHLVARWQALQDIINDCDGYLGGKDVKLETAGARAKCAQNLKDQATLRLAQEKAKGQFYGARVNEVPTNIPDGRRSAGVAVGGQTSGSKETRFERALRGGKTDPKTVIHG